MCDIQYMILSHMVTSCANTPPYSHPHHAYPAVVCCNMLYYVVLCCSMLCFVAIKISCCCGCYKILGHHDALPYHTLCKICCVTSHHSIVHYRSKFENLTSDNTENCRPRSRSVNRRCEKQRVGSGLGEYVPGNVYKKRIKSGICCISTVVASNIQTFSKGCEDTKRYDVGGTACEGLWQINFSSFFTNIFKTKHKSHKKTKN